MSTDKMLKLLKSGIWEDALIVFHQMRDWTIEDVYREFGTSENEPRLDLGNSSHIREFIKINNGLYMFPGGSWTIRFHNYPKDSDIITREYVDLNDL